MLTGATFGPNAKLVLPSGTELDGQEATLYIDLESSVGATAADETPALERCRHLLKAEEPYDTQCALTPGHPGRHRVLIEWDEDDGEWAQ
jgi:hypothetical protein